MTTVGIIGAGRVAHALAAACTAAGVPVVAVSSRSADTASSLAALAGQGCRVTDSARMLADADLTILAVTDESIPVVAHDLAAGVSDLAGRSVVHCSGALGPEVLAPLAALGADVGCWHPLQAFPTTNSRLRPGVTFAVTADPPLTTRLFALTTVLGAVPRPIDPAGRAAYHAAAVLSSNYLVTLLFHAALVLEDCGWTQGEARDALLPLVESTLEGVAAEGLAPGLTGPLVRGDLDTVRRHLAALTAYPVTLDLYRAAGRATLPLLAARNVEARLLVDATDMLTLSRNDSADTDGSAPGS